MAIEYKFREDELIQEFKDYIDATYSGHYGHGGFQSSEVIVDRGHGLGFFLALRPLRQPRNLKPMANIGLSLLLIKRGQIEARGDSLI